MVQNQNKSVPELRFKGFSDAWVQRKFFDNVKNVIDFRGRTPLKLGMDWSESGYLALSALNVKDGYIDVNQDAHYGGKELYQKWMGNVKLAKGDVLFTTEAPMGNVAQVPDDKGYILSQRTIALQTDDEVTNPTFFAQYLRSPQIQNTLNSVASGGTAKGVSQKTLTPIQTVVPGDVREQRKIGELLVAMDNLIAANQRKVDALKNQKFAYLERIFNQKLRFGGFTEPWVQRNLGEISPLRGGYAFKSTKFQSEGIPVVRISNIKETGSVGGEFAYYDQLPNDEKFRLTTGDLVLAMSGATTGKVATIPEMTGVVYQNQRVGFFTRSSNFDYGFVSSLIESAPFLYQLDSVLVQGAQPNVSSKEIDGFTFSVPVDMGEQIKIGRLVKSLNILIAANQKKVDTLTKQKSAYLQKLFV